MIAVAVAALGLFALVGIGLSFGSDSPGPANTAAEQAQESRSPDSARADRSDRDASPSAPGTPADPAPPSSGAPAAPPKTTPPAPKKTQPKAPAKPPAPRTTAPKPPPPPPAPVKPAPPPAWVHPMPGAAITSCFGPRGGVPHQGMDFASPPGTPVRSVGAGTVVAAGWAYTGYGISIVVNHGNGYLSHYAHLSGTAVGVGTRVGPGSTVGYEGSTGDSTGPHLHFEIHAGLWNQVEPASWLRARGVSVGC